METYKLITFLLIIVGCCAQDNSIFNEKLVEGVVVPEVHAPRASAFRGFLQCGYELACYLDSAEDMLEEKRLDLLAEADKEAELTQVGRGSSEKPSNLAGTIQKLLSEITSLIRSEIEGFLKDGFSTTNNKNASEDDEEEEEDRDLNGESRGKKKKKRRAIIKLLILGAVIKAKITLLLQFLSAALQVKFFLVALTGLVLNILRLWFDFKKGHNPQKVIYYEHAQHQHHYDHVDDEHGGFWGRAYEEPEDEQSAQDKAYSGQKPIPWAP